MSQHWTPSELIKLYQIEKTKTSIFRDEANGLIPKASRIKRGKTYIRVWLPKNLPYIGRVYSKLKPPKETKVIAVYSPKGGVLKSTVAHNFGRILALSGINVLIIGLEVQRTITRNLDKDDLIEIDSLDEIKSELGLYEAMKSIEEGGCNIFDTIKGTDLPTLSYIPESSNLNLLEQKIREQNRREHKLAKLINPLKKEFQVIIFDNSPFWSFLVQNSLVAATDVICPMACDVETYRSLTENIQMINDFKKIMELNWSSFTLIPTRLKKTKISKQIETQYRLQFPDFVTTDSLRESAKGEESSLQQITIIEHNPTSSLAEDYRGIINDIWQKINIEML